MLYVATRDDGLGRGLYAMDVGRQIPHAVSFGLEEYTSVSASADGRRLVASVANPTRNLWSVPVSERPVEDAGVSAFASPNVRAAAPRFGPDFLLYLSSSGRGDGIWKLKNGSATELWKGSDGAVVAAPAVSADASEICFVVDRNNRGTLYRMASDGSGAKAFGSSINVAAARGAPSWSADGKWVAVTARDGDSFPLLKVPVDGGAPVRLVAGLTRHPVWSPDGRFIVYSEVQAMGPDRLRAVTPEGLAVAVPDVRIRQRSGRYRFVPGTSNLLVVAQGEIWEQDFFVVDLVTGRRRQLTALSTWPAPERRALRIQPTEALRQV
jgi:Tol biopolymer transport system component